MKNKDIHELRLRIEKVISMFEAEIKSNHKAMFELILKRYRDAKSILENSSFEERDLENIRIAGGIRAFLDASSDYMHPVLEEMAQAEKLLGSIVNKN